jgi:hypothetical protein
LEWAAVLWLARQAIEGIRSMTPRSTVRCAIYTRVSTEQGLEQDFNSLDAQYDASHAYIRSQAHAGWTLLRAKYDAASTRYSAFLRNNRSDPYMPVSARRPVGQPTAMSPPHDIGPHDHLDPRWRR